MNKFKVGDKVYPEGSPHIEGTVVKIVWDDFLYIKWDTFNIPYVDYYGFVVGVGNMPSFLATKPLDYFDSEEYIDIENRKSILDSGYDDFLERTQERLG